MSRSDTLVMGAAVGYTRDRIAPFLVSLRRSGYRGDVLLLVDRTLAAQSDDPLFSDVQLLAVPQWLATRLKLFGRSRRARLLPFYRALNAVAWIGARGGIRAGLLPVRLAGLLLPPTESRFLFFHDFLRRRSYRRLLLTDTRDVLFQRDPFAQLDCDGLLVSFEAPALRLSDEPHNERWIRLAFGERGLAAVGSRRIACSGVTAGNGTAMARYLTAMTTALLRMPLRAVGESGVDQGIHNYLLWTGALGEVRSLEPLASAVATLGAMADADLHFDAAGRLLNRDGSIPAVVHQYDRIPRAIDTLLGALAL